MKDEGLGHDNTFENVIWKLVLERVVIVLSIVNCEKQIGS